jgi:ketosteroid isomerase-like protein
METAQQSYAAFGRGDLETIRSLLAEDAVWLTSDEVPDGGEVHGRDEIITRFANLPNIWQRFEVAPEEYIDGGDWVIVRGTQTAGGNGNTASAPFAHLMKFADGAIVRGEFYGDSAKLKSVL